MNPNSPRPRPDQVLVPSFPRPFAGLHLQAIRQAPAPQTDTGRAVGRAGARGRCRGANGPPGTRGHERELPGRPGTFFLALSLSCSPPYVARPPLFLCGGDRISLRLPRAPGRPGRVRGQGPLRRRRLRASRCRPRSSLGTDRPLAEPGGGDGGGGEGSWQPAASRSEEGAPRPTLLPAWSAAAPDTHGRAGFRAAKSQCRTPGPGVRAGAEVSEAPGAGTRTWAEGGARRGDPAAGRGPDGGGCRARVGRGRGVARPGFVWRRREAAGGRVGAAGGCSGSSVAGWERALGAEAQCHQVWGGDVGRRGAGPRELCECVLGGDGEPAARCVARSRVSGLRGPLVVTQDMALAACPRPGLYAGPALSRKRSPGPGISVVARPGTHGPFGVTPPAEARDTRAWCSPESGSAARPAGPFEAESHAFGG